MFLWVNVSREMHRTISLQRECVYKCKSISRQLERPATEEARIKLKKMLRGKREVMDISTPAVAAAIGKRKI